jgi:50S ribosomal subunit-associated GTPase HflX
VLETLEEMGCDQPAVLVVNKVDRLSAAEATEIAQRLGEIAGLAPVLVSATKGTGLRDLRAAVDALAAAAVPDTRANRPIMAAGTTFDLPLEPEPGSEPEQTHRAAS